MCDCRDCEEDDGLYALYLELAEKSCGCASRWKLHPFDPDTCVVVKPVNPADPPF